MQIIEKNRDITKSTIYFTPHDTDNGKMIGCRAENKMILDSGIEDSWTLTVYCKYYYLKHKEEDD